MELSLDHMTNLVQLHFSSDSYRSYNVDIARLIGVEEAIILYELVEQHKFYSKVDKLTTLEGQEGEWFYCSATRIEERTAIKEKQLLRVVKSLKSKGLIVYITAGLPAKRHFQINYEAIFKLSINDYSIPKWEDKESKEKNKDLEDSKKECKNSQMGRQEFPSGNTPRNINNTKNDSQKTHTQKKRSDTSDRVCDKSSKKSDKVLYQLGSHVQLTREEYDGFCEQYGKSTLDTLIEEMNDYCASSKPKGYADYAAAIRQWMRKRLGQGVQPKKERKFAPCSDDNKAREYLEEGAKTAL